MIQSLLAFNLFQDIGEYVRFSQIMQDLRTSALIGICGF